MVKNRRLLKNSDSLSASTTLILVLENILKLFAPFVPMITEEIWTTMHPDKESIHIQDWPQKINLDFKKITSNEFEIAREAISCLRKEKTSQEIGLGKEIGQVKLITNDSKKSLLEKILPDVKDAARAESIELVTDNDESGIRSII